MFSMLMGAMALGLGAPSLGAIGRAQAVAARIYEVRGGYCCYCYIIIIIIIIIIITIIIIRPSPPASTRSAAATALVITTMLQLFILRW